MKKISASVGRKGKNKLADVKIVQELLSQKKLVGFSVPLKIDGKIGLNTIKRIEAFQKNIVKIIHPDGLINPNDISMKALNKFSISAISLRLLKVSYSSDIPSEKQIVSIYAISVIKMALKKSGMSQAVITSTIRKPEEQATIMYKNAKKNLLDQFKLYGSTGDKVLSVYKANKTRAKDNVVKLMKEEIEDQLKKGNKTSQHVVTESQYKMLNIFDIGVNSTRAMEGAAFSVQKFTNALIELKKDGYIKKLIDETKKTNSCWHIEIKPDAKVIPK